MKKNYEILHSFVSRKSLLNQRNTLFDLQILQLNRCKIMTSKNLGHDMGKIIKLSDIPKEDALVACVTSLRTEGRAIAVPTDTIYGLATTLPNTDELYRIKGRNKLKPVAICVPTVESVAKYGDTSVLPSCSTNSLLDRLLPGPVTVVLRRRGALPSAVNPETDRIGIRVPDNGFIRELTALLAEPIALTSANPSAAGSTLRIEEFSELWPQLGLIVDGGPCPPSRAGSTVVDLSEPSYFTVLRDGSALESTIKILTDEEFGLKERKL